MPGDDSGDNMGRLASTLEFPDEAEDSPETGSSPPSPAVDVLTGLSPPCSRDWYSSIAMSWTGKFFNFDRSLKADRCI